MRSLRSRKSTVRVARAAVMAGLLVASVAVTTSSGASADTHQVGVSVSSTGLKPNQIKHVWLMTYHPVLVPGKPRPPKVLVAGRSVSFELRAVLPTGEGLMRWAPDGRHIAASWDFAVEND